MPYCPKCGEKLDEEMALCPKCGASLRIKQPEDWRQQWRERRREAEIHEKGEEWERNEKAEKNEKHLYFFIGPLVGVLVLAGLILMSLGLIFYMLLIGGPQFVWASFLVIIELLAMAGAIY